MKLLFAESKLREIETLKIELKSAHQINQQLRDEVSLLRKRLEEEDSKSKSRIRSMELDNSQAMAEVIRLKNLLVHEERAKESAKAKARKVEDELMIERRRCTEFSALFERAKKEIVALPDSEKMVNIESQMLFPRSSLSEMNFPSDSSQKSFFPFELFYENENDKDDSDIYVPDSDTAVSLPRNDSKNGLLSLSS
ncbi:unnamed protein product [Onchocerca ochengi]|uniref:Filament-like plant protein 7 n=1 Tax=Onchocerca ochengi TaxID=42157 RepID=A0A182EUL8_ONCOC|nr:unnamed protein product [Onchocerca ochengi]